MSRFLVETDESVKGVYMVEADTEEEARARFSNPRIDWDHVEQIDYMAYECEVRSASPKEEK